MERIAFLWAVAAGALVLGGCSTTSEARHAAGSSDDYFMVRASQMNLSEIATGKMASDRAMNEDVRAYGQEMVDAHQQANRELQQLAEQRGVSLADRPDEAHVELSQHLARLDGEAFDREYIGSMVANHAKALSMFQDRAQNASDPELRAWAQQMVPVLESHLEQARSIQRDLERMAPASTH